MKKTIFAIVFFIGVVFIAGCSHVRTYTVEEERVDQNLTEGNQGYFAGKPKESDALKNRKLTRKTYVAEVELGSSVKKAKKKTASGSGQSVTMESAQEPANEQLIQEPHQGEVQKTVAKVSSYTVENNDTLEKISLKVYGTTKKWKKIFEANQDQLKTPDRIYAGEVLKIPQE